MSVIDLSETNRLLKEITEYAESTPIDAESVKTAFDSLDACIKAVLFSIELKRRRRRNQIEKFLGFQRRILQWVFNAKKIKKQSPA